MKTIVLNNWTMRPSSGLMTVKGRDLTGAERKVTKVRQVYPGQPGENHWAWGRCDADEVRVELA